MLFIMTYDIIERAQRGCPRDVDLMILRSMYRRYLRPLCDYPQEFDRSVRLRVLRAEAIRRGHKKVTRMSNVQLERLLNPTANILDGIGPPSEPPVAAEVPITYHDLGISLPYNPAYNIYPITCPYKKQRNNHHPTEYAFQRGKSVRVMNS